MNRHPLVPCYLCFDRVPVDAMHDLHDSDCPLFVAASDGRDPTDDEYEQCTCPERLVCSSCCPVCGTRADTIPTREGEHHR